MNDWVDRHGVIANADVVRIAKVDTLRASKLLGKGNMAYPKPARGAEAGELLSGLEENKP